MSDIKVSSSELNQNASFPNLDQLSEEERSIYIKEHEFQTKINDMILSIEAMMSDTSGDIANNKMEVSRKLNELIAALQSKLNSINAWKEKILIHTINVEAAFERLYAKIYTDIIILNQNIIDRTVVYDTVASYLSRLRTMLFLLYRRKNIFYESNKNAQSENDIWTVEGAYNNIVLRDIDESNRMITYPVVIDPSISINDHIEICKFTPLYTRDEEIPRFLANVIISGDLVSFEGVLTTRFVEKSKNKAGAFFVCDYFIRQDVDFSIKVMHDPDEKKIGILYKYEANDSGLSSIIKFDFSIQLLVGLDLEFSKPNTIVKI